MKSQGGQIRPGRGSTYTWVAVFIAVLITASFVFTWQFVDPPPPRSLTLATGYAGGRYHEFGLRLQQKLKGSGLSINLRQTSGSMENLALLSDPTSGVSLALVQSGLQTPAGEQASNAARPISLGTLFYEPVWIFVAASAGDVSNLRLPNGTRVAIGVEGSGVRPVALSILAAADLKDVLLSDLGGEKARDALKQGEIDAAFFVMSADSPLIRDLLKDPLLRPLPFPNARAFSVRNRFLKPIRIETGVVDIPRNLPSEPLPLVACAATFAAVENLHPAVIPLLLDAAGAVLADGGLIEQPGEFPSPLGSTLPLAEEAGRFYTSGPPFLQRYLPFRIASLIDRLKIMLVPVLTLLFPVVRLAGPTWRWRARGKIIRWYRVLRDIDHDLVVGAPMDAQAELDKIGKVKRETLKLRVPLSFADNLYQLQAHLDQVAERLQARINSSGGDRETSQPSAP